MTNNKIKVLHMTPSDINNGVYRYIFNHLQYMDMQKYQFAFLTKGAEELKATQEYRQYKFPVHMLLNTQRDSQEKMRKEIVDVLNQHYDVIHLHTSSWRGFLIEQIAMEMGVGHVIVHSHSTGIDVPDNVERKKQMEEHERYKNQFSLKYATDVCACSVLAAEWLFSSKIPHKEIKILPNAIDVEKYHFNPKKRRELRTRLNLENRIVIGNVGRYSYQKNQEFLIKVFSQAHAKNKSLFLICLGEGELLEQLKKLIKQLDIEESAVCIGWQEKVEDYLQAMDVFCLPSRFEGLPISAIEAQAAGLKCMISDNVTKEVQITDLVQFIPLKEECWFESLAECKSDRCRDTQDSEIIKAGYDIRIAAKRLEEIYKE